MYLSCYARPGRFLVGPFASSYAAQFQKTGDVSWKWTGFSAASNVIGSDDFEFEVIYRLNALQNPNYIFYHSDTQGSVNVGFTDSLIYLTIGRVKNPETGTRKTLERSSLILLSFPQSANG